jgi:hypothetical protein
MNLVHTPFLFIFFLFGFIEELLDQGIQTGGILLRRLPTDRKVSTISPGLKQLTFYSVHQKMFEVKSLSSFQNP